MRRIDAPAWAGLVSAASAPYARSGHFAWHFARGKLRWDPVFRHLIDRGLIAPRSRVLDIGCGQGLLASLLIAAGSVAGRGAWPVAWGDAPVGAHVTGIELMPRDVERARAALGDAADVLCADMRQTPFPGADIVVMLDVLHYIGLHEQDEVLGRARAALVDGGRIVLRVGDSASRVGFTASHWVDRAVMLLRGRGTRAPTGRTRAEWRSRLVALGFEIASETVHRGTTFANVLFVATLPGGSRPGATA